MSATLRTARDEIGTRLRTEWEGDSVTQNDAVKLLWAGVKDDPPTGTDANGWPKPWARASIQPNTGEQESLVGADGEARFAREGIVSIQIFTAAGLGEGGGDDIVEVALRAFDKQATSSGVWFFNVRPQPAMRDGQWFMASVIAEFKFYQHR